MVGRNTHFNKPRYPNTAQNCPVGGPKRIQRTDIGTTHDRYGHRSTDDTELRERVAEQRRATIFFGAGQRVTVGRRAYRRVRVCGDGITARRCREKKNKT